MISGTQAHSEIPAEGLETPYGHLYRPLTSGKQVIVLVASFVASMSLGGWLAVIPGDLSSAAQVILHIPYILVFFVGYSVWVARLNAIAFDGIGRSLIKMLWNLIIYRKEPTTLAEVLPSREKLLEMLVKGQRAGASFRGVSWPIALAGALCAMLFESAMPSMALAAMIAASVVGLGHILGFLGRRGWLPFPEND